VDCHFDNIVACGEHPVLVDAEMLFQPKLPGDTSAQAETVLRTGLLPQPKAQSCDFSGFGCVSAQPTPLRIPEWQKTNCNLMALRFRNATLHPRSNLAVLNGATLSPLDYVDSLVEGFRDMYRCVLKNRSRLVDPAGPLASFAGQRVRILARGTLEYYLALTRMLHPKSLRVPDWPEVALDSPSRFPLLESLEANALRQMDVPRLLVEASAKYLPTADGRGAAATFLQSGVERVYSEIENLSEAHMAEQEKLIRFTCAFAAMSRLSAG
jgi:lantibiotic modifying enzyme